MDRLLSIARYISLPLPASCLEYYASSSLHLKTAIFPGEPGLACFIGAKDDGGGGDKLTTGAVRHAKLQSNRYYQQTNTKIFTGRMPFLSPNQPLLVGRQEGHPWYQSTVGKR